MGEKYVINQKQFSFPQSIASIAVQLLNTAGKRIKESSRDVIIYFIHQNEIKMHRAFRYVLEIKKKIVFFSFLLKMDFSAICHFQKHFILKHTYIHPYIYGCSPSLLFSFLMQFFVK